MRLRLRHVDAVLNVAGQEADRNLFSQNDNADFASAAAFRLKAGERRIDRRTLWFDGDYRYSSRNFSSEIFTADERRESWGASDIVDNTGDNQTQTWDAAVGATVVRGAEVSVGAGQSFVDSVAATEKLTVDSRLRFAGERYGVDFGGAFFRHRLSDVDNTVRRHGRFIARPRPSVDAFVEYRDEWRVFSDAGGGGGGG